MSRVPRGCERVAAGVFLASAKLLMSWRDPRRGNEHLTLPINETGNTLI